MRARGVLGYPVGHSRSPAMMDAAFRELGLDWRYVKLPVPPELFERDRAGAARLGLPRRERDHPAQAGRARARRRGDRRRGRHRRGEHARFEGGRIRGDNTDAGGLLDALEAELAGAPRPGSGRRWHGPRRGLGAA